MTDEEKAEEYVNREGFGSDFNDIESYDANEAIRQAYLDGLAEGRKLLGRIKKRKEEDVEYWKNEYYYLKANPN